MFTVVTRGARLPVSVTVRFAVESAKSTASRLKKDPPVAPEKFAVVLRSHVAPPDAPIHVRIAGGVPLTTSCTFPAGKLSAYVCRVPAGAVNARFATAPCVAVPPVSSV